MVLQLFAQPKQIKTNVIRIGLMATNALKMNGKWSRLHYTERNKMFNVLDFIKPGCDLQFYKKGRLFFKYIRHDEKYAYVKSIPVFGADKVTRHKLVLHRVTCVRVHLPNGGYFNVNDISKTYYDKFNRIHNLEGPAQIIGRNTLYGIDGEWISEDEWQMITFTLHRKAQNGNNNWGICDV